MHANLGPGFDGLETLEGLCTFIQDTYRDAIIHLHDQWGLQRSLKQWPRKEVFQELAALMHGADLRSRSDVLRTLAWEVLDRGGLELSEPNLWFPILVGVAGQVI